jgi:cytochrome c-type biogenesis protein CcmH
MLLWVCFAILTASVVALLLRPLRRAETAVVEPAAADLAVYRDQLRELDAERDRGLVVDSEIESARAEVARRLLKRAGKNEAGDGRAAASSDTASEARAQKIYLGVAAVLPVLAIGLYLVSGSPELSGRPFAERKPAEETGNAVAAMISKVEERLRAHPEDGKGWDVIAPIYLRLGRYGDAVHAFAEANRLEGETVKRLLGFAEASLLAGNGIVSEDVRRTALRILELEPKRIEVGVWLALAKEQDGDLAGAADAYRALLAKAPDGAQWRGAVSERLDLVSKKLAGEKPGEAAAPDTPALRAPPAAAQAPSASAPATTPESAGPDVAAMTPEQRDAFILSMVNRLAARLKENGKDAEGWIRLARAYKVLGRDQEAEQALATARANFADDKAVLDEIGRAEQSLNQVGKEPSPQ